MNHPLTTTHTTRWVVSALLASLAISAVLVGVRGVPAPKIQDEFAYLLGADTFASGRLTNPTHPCWQSFETIHVIHRPSYNAKYPPLQSLVLAFGQVLWHPYLGVCLSTAMAIAATVWMLIGWLPRRWHALAWWLVVLHPGIHTYWGHSYWGGGLAMTGSALLLGSMVRSWEMLQWRHAVLAGLGMLILANSRPFEGAVLSLSVLLALTVKHLVIQPGQISTLVSKAVLPAGVILVGGFALMGYYNHAVTGDPLRMPYQVHEDTYAWNPVFVWQAAGEPPQYNHRDMYNFFAFDKQTTERAFSSPSAILANKVKVVVGLFDFFCGPMILLAAIALIVQPSLVKRKQVWLLAGLLLPVFLASISSKWANFHYAAPAAPLMLLVAVFGAGVLWRKTEAMPQVRRMGAMTLLAFHCLWVIAVIKETGRQDADNWGDQRIAFLDQLKDLPGKDLVLVRYDDDHHEHHEWIEWVYNRADIDSAEVVWARQCADPSTHQKLLNWARDRRLWQLNADAETIQLEPFESSRDEGSMSLQVTTLNAPNNGRRP